LSNISQEMKKEFAAEVDDQDPDFEVCPLEQYTF